MLEWFGEHLPIFVGKFGWLAALVTVVVLVAIAAGVILLLGIDIAGAVDRWLGG